MQSRSKDIVFLVVTQILNLRFIIIIVFGGLGIEPRSLCMLSVCSLAAL